MYLALLLGLIYADVLFCLTVLSDYTLNTAEFIDISRNELAFFFVVLYYCMMTDVL